MTKRFIAWFLVMTFLNLTIASGPILAYSYKGSPPPAIDIDEAQDKSNERILVGSAIVLGVMLIIYIIIKGITSKRSGLKSATPNQESASYASKAHEERPNSSGEVVVLRW